MTYQVKSIMDARNTAAQRAYAASKPKNLVPARTLVNSSALGLYTGHSMSSTRAGADDHQQHKSIGLRVQLEVRTA